MTTWRAIPGCPGYDVSDDGRVMSHMLSKPHLMKLTTDKDGYQAVQLAVNKRQVWHRAHRLVLLAFVGPPPADKPLTRHIDGDPTNNHVSNLAWGDNSENQRDRVAHGTDPNASREACDNGHDFTPENTRWRTPHHPHPWGWRAGRAIPCPGIREEAS
jgi:hypothetical protein